MAIQRLPSAGASVRKTTGAGSGLAFSSAAVSGLVSSSDAGFSSGAGAPALAIVTGTKVSS